MSTSTSAPPVSPVPSRVRTRRFLLLGCLGGLGLLLNLAIVYLASDLLLGPRTPTTAPLPEIDVPYEDEPVLWRATLWRETDGARRSTLEARQCDPARVASLARIDTSKICLEGTETSTRGK